MAVRRPTLRWFPVVAGISALQISILLPTLNRLRDAYRTTGRQPCPSNLRQIGQALLLYSMEHDGVFPMSLDALVTPDLLTEEVLVCYYARKPFVFLAPGGVANSYDENDLIAYELPECHEEGSNLLFGDGHVRRESAAVVRQHVARAATRPAATTPATRP